MAPEYGYGLHDPFTVGIEDELLLVDPISYDLAPNSHKLLEHMALPVAAASSELYLAEIELRSPPCTDAWQATDILKGLRQSVSAAGGTAIGSGIHPNAQLGDAPHAAGARYTAMSDTLRGLGRRTPDAAFQVHIGAASNETAIRMFNGLRPYLPLFLALSANSPYWFGDDSGAASSRAMLTRSHPRRGIPPTFHDFTDYQETVNSLLYAADASGPTFIWWDMRIRDDLGTIEVREMDSQTSLNTSAGLATLIQGLAMKSIETSPDRPPIRDALMESSFRAARDGLDARILHAGHLQPVRVIATDVIDSVRPYLHGHSSESALESLERLLHDGAGADYQRALHRKGGMRTLLAGLIAATTPTNC